MRSTGKKAKPPKAPGHLSAESKKFWRWAVEEFVLELHDFRLLKLACESLDMAEGARVQLAKEGVTFLDVRGKPRAHPAVAIERDASITAARLIRELRLSEAAEDARPPRTGGRKW
jgi:phage terminase small subunit